MVTQWGTAKAEHQKALEPFLTLKGSIWVLRVAAERLSPRQSPSFECRALTTHGSGALEVAGQAAPAGHAVQTVALGVREKVPPAHGDGPAAGDAHE